jgi:hypothetical protein
MKDTGPLARSWQSYRDQVIPPNAPEIQLLECRRAFYAGAAGFLASATRLAIADAADPVETLREELLAFDAEVRARTA